jgi:hypothetical protein
MGEIPSLGKKCLHRTAREAAVSPDQAEIEKCDSFGDKAGVTGAERNSRRNEWSKRANGAQHSGGNKGFCQEGRRFPLRNSSTGQIRIRDQSVLARQRAHRCSRVSAGHAGEGSLQRESYSDSIVSRSCHLPRRSSSCCRPGQESHPFLKRFRSGPGRWHRTLPADVRHRDD